MKHAIYTALLLGLVTLVAPIQGQEKVKKSPDSIEKETLGSTKNVHRAGDLYFAGQFSSSDLELIKDSEFTRIITLRTDGEIDWDEKSQVESQDITFIKIPFRKPETLTDEVFDKVRQLLKDKSGKTLFHCGSANRVGGAWLPYRVLDEGVDLESALKEAEMIGLKTPFIREKAIEYIKRKQKTKPKS